MKIKKYKVENLTFFSSFLVSFDKKKVVLTETSAAYLLHIGEYRDEKDHEKINAGCMGGQQVRNKIKRR